MAQPSTEETLNDPLSAALRIEARIRLARKRSHLRIRTSVGAEDRFDGLVEQLRDREGQGETRIVLASLDGVYRLPGDVKPLREIGLGPRPLCPQDAEAIGHRYLRRTTNCPSDQLRNNSSQSQCQESAIPVFGTTSNLASRPYAITTMPVSPN